MANLLELYNQKQGKKSGGGVEGDWGDQTLGALSYGAADVGQQLGGFVGLDQMAQSLKEYKDNHPEYAPEEVDNTLDLISNPKALAGRVFGQIPSLLLLGGTYSIPGAGWAISGALAYAMESQRAYDAAKLGGATDDQATTNARVKGLVNAAFQILPIHKMFKFGAGAEKQLLDTVASEAIGQLEKQGVNVGTQAGKFIVTNSLLGALQGGSDELLSKGIYGAPVAPGFWDRRLQDAVGANLAATVFGLGKRVLGGKGGEVNAGESKPGLVSEVQPSDAQTGESGALESHQKYTFSDPRLPSVSELPQADPQKNIEVQVNEDPVRSSLARAVKGAGDLTARVLRGTKGMAVSMVSGMPSTPALDRTIQGFMDVHTYTTQQKAVFGEVLSQLVQSEPQNLKALAEIKKIQPTGGGPIQGWSGLSRQLDTTSVPPELHLPLTGNYGPALDFKNRFLGKEAGVAGVQTETSKGVQPYQQPEETRVMRVYSNRMREAVIRGAGRDYESLVDAVMAWPENEFKTREAAGRALPSELGGDPIQRLTGTLEFQRQIKVLPDVIYPDGPGGRPFELLIRDPIRTWEQNVEIQARGIAATRVFGDSKLKTATDMEIKQVLKAVGVDPENISDKVLRNTLVKNFNVAPEDLFSTKSPLSVGDRKGLLKIPGVTPELVSKYEGMSLSELYQEKVRLRDLAGKSQAPDDPSQPPVDKIVTPPVVDQLTKNEYQLVDTIFQAKSQSPFIEGKDLRRLAQIYDAPISPVRSMYIDAMGSVDPSGFTRKQTSLIGKTLGRLGGYTITGDPVQDWQSLRDKSKVTMLADGLKELMDKHVAQASSGSPKENSEAFLSAVQLAQGIPVNSIGGGITAQLVQNASRLIGAAQTSLAVIPNTVQTIATLTGFGKPLELGAAIDTAIKNAKPLASDLATIGALVPAVNTYAHVIGDPIGNFTRGVQTFMAKVTGLTGVERFNNLVSGDFFRRWGESLRQGEISTGDRATLKTLKFTPEEITQIHQGEMTDFQFSKFIQRGIAFSQFRTEQPLLKAGMENSPLLKTIFAYSSYLNGMARYVGGMGAEIKEGMLSRDPAQMVNAGKKLVLSMAGFIGAGATAQLLRQAINGKFQESDEGKVSLAMKALVQVGALGPVQRTLEPFKYDQGDINRTFVSLAPQLSALVDLTGALLGYGKYGKFEIDERLTRLAERNIPLVKPFAPDNFTSWVNALAYPELDEYVRAKGLANTWEKKILGTDQLGIAGDESINPAYFKVFESVARGDVQAAQEKVKLYMQAELPALAHPGNTKTPEDVILGLRNSLMQRAPLNLKEENLFRFLASQTPETRKKLVQEHLRYVGMVEQLVPSGR